MGIHDIYDGLFFELKGKRVSAEPQTAAAGAAKESA
jgi:hypothetical protein